MAWFRRGGQPGATDRSVSIVADESDADELEVRRVLPSCVSLACLSGKGGVGKTTTAINLGAALAELGLTVLAVDCDPQSNLTSGLGLDPYRVSPTVGDVMQGRCGVMDAVVETRWENLFLLPASPDLSAVEQGLSVSLGRETLLRDAMRRDRVHDRFDVVVYDTPPNFGFHTVNVLAATRWVLVPLQMSGFALRGLKELLRVTGLAAERLNPELEVLGVVPTFVNLRTRLSRDMLPALCDISGVSVFPVHVPYTVRLQESSLVGVPIGDLAPSAPAAEAYRRLATEVLAAVDAAAADGRARA